MYMLYVYKNIVICEFIYCMLVWYNNVDVVANIMPCFEDNISFSRSFLQYFYYVVSQVNTTLKKTPNWVEINYLSNHGDKIVCIGTSYLYKTQAIVKFTNAPWRMDGKWSRNNLLAGSNSLVNRDGYLNIG
jgi:hypothetical protein